MNPTLPLIGDAILRRIAQTVNAILDGRQNNVGSVTLTASDTTTTVTDYRVGADSVITFMPTTSTAASAMDALYVSSIDPLTHTFVITHDSTADTDRTFKYEVTG